jgi:predicted acyl esterase
LKRRPRSRFALGALAGASAILTLALAPAAGAAVPDVFGGEIPCVDQAADGHVRFCGGEDTTVPTWDGTTPIDVNVALPPEPASGADGPYPLVMIFHGWGGSESGYAGMKGWAEAGYAVFSMSDRGWGMSCGGMDLKRLTPACAQGYNHLMDTRFEVRDAQHFAGLLADEGIAQPNKIGATGGSYGGGMSMALAALRDRVMLPDGSLVDWESPGGSAMEIAAAQPDIPWTDLGYSLAPNGHTLDYVADAPYFQRNRIGVLKQSFVAGLYGTGLATSNYALPLTDPDADLTTWFALLNAGEPYDSNPLAHDIVDEVTTHHSSYYIDHSQPPAPLLISNGWTDDLFPPDEAIRFYNRTRTEHPGADISLLFSDHGHQRGQNKDEDADLRTARREAWFAHYLKGEGPAPALGVEALTQTCPSSDPSGGPYTAPTWREIAPGEIRLAGAASQVVGPVAANPDVGLAYDPIAGGGACATAPGADAVGAASYRLPAAPAGGYTLLGSPTIVADLNSLGPTSQLAARLVDVAPGGDATLVARGIYRPEVNSGASPTRQVFQLHPNGWEFEEGHIAKLELLPSDVPYGRISNVQLPVTVSNLELRLPVLESPGSLGGLVEEPAAKVVPPGYELAADYLAGPSLGGDPASPAPKPKAKRKCKRRAKNTAKRKGKKIKRCKPKKRRKRR